MEEVKCYYNSPVSLAQAEKYIEASLVTTAREYVAIGHWLRRIRDDKLFLEEGYRNFEEYVRQKYHKDAGWASKCIKVNAQAGTALIYQKNTGAIVSTSWWSWPTCQKGSGSWWDQIHQLGQ